MSDMAQPLRNPIPESLSYSDRIRERVEADDVMGARALVAEALERGESDKDVLYWQKVLAPAKIIRVGGGGEKAPDPTPDIQWLHEHSKNHDGQWVALCRGELLAHATSLEEVLSAVREQGRKATLFHRIYHRSEPAGLAEARTYAEKIRMLVEADFVGEARKVLAEALERGDHDEDLSGWQRVLGPAKIICRSSPTS